MGFKASWWRSAGCRHPLHCCATVMHDYLRVRDGKSFKLRIINGKFFSLGASGGKNWNAGIKQGTGSEMWLEGWQDWNTIRGKPTNLLDISKYGAKNLFVCRGGSNIDSFVAVVTSSEKIVAPLIGSCPTPPSGSSLSGQNDRDLCDKKIERFLSPFHACCQIPDVTREQKILLTWKTLNLLLFSECSKYVVE